MVKVPILVTLGILQTQQLLHIALVVNLHPNYITL